MIVRCRPFLDSEIKRNENKVCVFVEKESNQVSIMRDKHTKEYKTFRYDGVFDEYSN